MTQRKAFDRLDAAKAKITERGKQYGDVVENWERTATFGNGALQLKLKEGETLSAADIGMFMTGLKMARLVNAPDHEDSQEDAIAYIALLSEVT